LNAGIGPPPFVTWRTTVSNEGERSSRFGPTLPLEPAFENVWQLPHPALVNTFSPLAASPAVAPVVVDSVDVVVVSVAVVVVGLAGRRIGGERLGLIGPNGSGKTTMINCISGALFNDDGTVVFNGQDITSMPAYKRARMGIARSFQIPRPFKSMTVLENMCVPLEYAARDRADPA